jgi:hypothetical protein
VILSLNRLLLSSNIIDFKAPKALLLLQLYSNILLEYLAPNLSNKASL